MALEALKLKALRPNTDAVLHICGKHLSAEQPVEVVDKEPGGVLVCHPNGWVRYLTAPTADSRTFRDPEAPEGVTFRLVAS